MVDGSIGNAFAEGFVSSDWRRPHPDKNTKTRRRIGAMPGVEFWNDFLLDGISGLFLTKSRLKLANGQVS